MQTENRDLILSRIERADDGCWLWPNLSPKGYPQVSIAGRTVGAHRVSYSVFVGEIPEGYEVDHLCRTKACVNPEHLEAVTQLVNLHRRRGRFASASPRP